MNEPVRFNTQPPEGGWLMAKLPFSMLSVSTHSRPKAAGGQDMPNVFRVGVSTHSRPKAAGEYGIFPRTNSDGFNTQPPEGGWEDVAELFLPNHKFQHTAARRRLEKSKNVDYLPIWFQHTAARRRLENTLPHKQSFMSFNTQPPEGGWVL